MVFERLMWGSDWNDPRLTALLQSRQPDRACAACDRPVETTQSGAEGRLLCARCEADGA
jgi:hypothetical protein